MKIADFGLSKHLYDDPVYVKNQDGKLPIRWMAIEAILERKYSVQSDVYVTTFCLLYFAVVLHGQITFMLLSLVSIEKKRSVQFKYLQLFLNLVGNVWSIVTSTTVMMSCSECVHNNNY